MEKRIVFNILKKKGFKVSVSYDFCLATIRVTINATKVWHDKDFNYSGENYHICWFGDKLTFVDYLKSIDLTEEEISLHYSRYNDTELESKLTDMLFA